MPDTIIGASLTLDPSQANTSVRDFKKELKEAQQEVVILSDKFGEMSPEVAAAAKRAAELKDKIGDAKSLVDAFNPDTKFKAFGAAVNTVVGGFSALQGVMGLVGVESEDVQKSLLKVQAALAISQGVAQLQEGLQTFKNLGAVIQQTTIFQKANAVATNLAAGAMRLLGLNAAATSTGFKVMKVAIASTGIGLLIVGLAAAANALGLFSSKTEKATEAQDKLAAAIQKVNDALQDYKLNSDQLTKLELAQAKARGASSEELFKIEESGRERNIAATQKHADELRKINGAAADKLQQQVNFDIRELEIFRLNKQGEEREAAKRHADALAKDAKEKRDKALQEQIQFEKDRKKALDEALRAPAEKLEDDPDNDPILDVFGRPKQEMVDAVVGLYSDISAQGDEFRKSEDEKKKQSLETERQIAKEKIQLAQDVGNALGVLSDLVGRQTAAGKVLAIAQATINTWLGVTEVLKSKSVLPEPFGTISKLVNVAAVIATGISAVKNIVKTNVPGASGGGAGSLGAPPPLAPVPQNTTTTLDQNSLNQIGNAAGRAFVLESDIQNNRERIVRLNRAARI